MNSLLRMFFLLGVAWPLAGGCAHTPPKAQPAVIASAITFNRNGVDFEKNGDSRRAREALAESLRLSASVEYTPGVAAALINLARLERRAGELDAARRHLEQATGKVGTNDPLRYELSFEAALIHLAGNELDLARQAAERAVSSAPGSRRGPALALRARVLAIAGQRSAAQAQAEAALRRNREEGALLEAANCARLLGDLAAATDGARAESFYLQALDYDRQAASSPRIAEDLRRLAAARRTLDDRAGAIAYLQRASEVALNNRDHVDAASDLTLLAELYRQQGDTPHAEAAERLRQSLVAPTP